MMMYIIPCVLVIIVAFAYALFKDKDWAKATIIAVIAILLTVIIIGIDYSSQVYDEEVWSGTVDNWHHKDAYDEWIEATYDDKGNVSTPGHYDHHNAENQIHTTDNGWIDVHQTPSGRRIDDDYPKSESELQKNWPAGIPSSSVHTYKNKVQASYSIYKHKEIDVKQYPDLPDYPKSVHNYINIDRIIGTVPNKANALKELDKQNTEMNKFIPDPEKPGKKRSWKQVNLIFVNVGDNKPEEYGFALQDRWEGGNKNDFIVAFSAGTTGRAKWVYPFSWSEVEMLKIDVRNYIMDQAEIKDFVPIVNNVSDMVKDQFIRKQFADFNYLQIEVSTGANVAIWIFNVILLFAIFLIQTGSSGYVVRTRRSGYY